MPAELRVEVCKHHFASLQYRTHFSRSKHCKLSKLHQFEQQNLLLSCRTVNAEATPISLKHAQFMLDHCRCWNPRFHSPLCLDIYRISLGFRRSIRMISHLGFTPMDDDLYHPRIFLRSIFPMLVARGLKLETLDLVYPIIVAYLPRKRKFAINQRCRPFPRSSSNTNIQD